MANGRITLADIIARTDTLELACDRCGLHAEYRVSELFAFYGPDCSDWREQEAWDCPRMQRQRSDKWFSYYDLCGIQCPTLARVF